MGVTHETGDPLGVECDLLVIPVSDKTETSDETYQALKALHPLVIEGAKKPYFLGEVQLDDSVKDPKFVCLLLSCMSVHKGKREVFYPRAINAALICEVMENGGMETANIVLPGFGDSSLEGREERILVEVQNAFGEAIDDNEYDCDIRIFTPPHQPS